MINATKDIGFETHCLPRKLALRLHTTVTKTTSRAPFFWRFPTRCRADEVGGQNDAGEGNGVLPTPNAPTHRSNFEAAISRTSEVLPFEFSACCAYHFICAIPSILSPIFNASWGPPHGGPGPPPGKFPEARWRSAPLQNRVGHLRIDRGHRCEGQAMESRHPLASATDRREHSPPPHPLPG